MAGIFRLIKTAPLSMRVRSRESGTYMYRSMKFAGWIPPKQGLKRYLYLFWASLVFAFSTIYLPTGLGLSLVMDFKRFTPGEFLGVLQISVNIIGAAVKGILTQILLKRLDQAMDLLDKLDELLQSDSDRRKIHKAVARCNYAFWIYAAYYIGYTLSVFAAGVLTGQPPWLGYNPLFDWRAGVGSLWLQAILEYIILFMMATSILIMDTYPIIFLIIFRAHIDVLKDHIRDLRTDPIKTEAENYEELVNCIVYHKLILKCCDLIRPVISRTIFIQFLLIGIVLGVTLVNVLYFSGLFRGISSIIFLVAVSLQTFPFCYLCDLFVGDFEDLSNLLGQSCWVDAEPKYKSTLMFFMHHVQQPVIFNAGGIFDISMNTNIKVAKFAFSVMTIVQEMNLADRLN